MNSPHLTLPNKHYARTFRAAVLIPAFCALAACTTVEKLNPWHSNNDLEKVVIISLPDANQRYAVEMDIVFLFDGNLAQPIGQLTAAQWFGEKEAYLQSYSSRIKVHHVEPMPGGTLTLEEFPTGHQKAVNILLFANYIPQRRPHRADLTDYKTAKVILRNAFFTVESGP